MLKNLNFRYLWLGRLVSNAGDSLYYIVLSWYILQITRDSFWVGAINFAIFIPTIFSFIFGHWIDTHSKKRALILCELGQLVAIALMVSALLLHVESPAFIVCFSIYGRSIWYEYLYDPRCNDTVYSQKGRIRNCSIIHVSSLQWDGILIQCFSGLPY